ncbi:MAG: DUF327 family protein [Proteobacteria bacterium]|nr:DUF327 family protein [Pseudomonadota bacterium]
MAVGHWIGHNGTMPIRIRDRSTAANITRSRTPGQPAAAGTRPAGTGPASFAEALTSVQRTVAQQDLDRLYMDVEEQGRRLLEDPTPEGLAHYKSAIRNFIAHVVKNGLKLKSAIAQRELHQVIDRIDEELLSMADGLIAKEKPLLELAEKVGQINGMLLDMRA